MDKIYGYKEQDVIGLARFLKERGHSSLSSTFERYSAFSGKAKGTVRNLYYALAKKSCSDKSFCDKYLDGQEIKVSKIIEFDKCAEKELVKKVLMGKQQGRSVRGVIMELASGDGKLALRYQNKFRNAVKLNPQLVSNVIAEIKGDKSLIHCGYKNSSANNNVAYNNDKNLLANSFSLKIKREIDAFFNKNTTKLQKENEYLKSRVLQLEKQNSALSTMLYGENLPKTALKALALNSGVELHC